MKKFRLLFPILFLAVLLFFGAFINVSAKQTYDISQYQGYITNHQARNLRHEVNFMILRTQYGSGYQDPEFNHNAYEMSIHHIPYGAYDYSLYSNGRQARCEAYTLYRRAPQAKFYVNDSEENRAGQDLNQATYDWASEIHRLTAKPAVLYSDEAFMNKFNNRARRHYNALWIAAYSRYQPNPGYRYDLWQYTDGHYSRALGERLDASIFPNGWIKSLSFWTRNRRNHRRRAHLRITKLPRRYKRPGFGSFNVVVNGKAIRLLKSGYRTGSHHSAIRTGFREGPRLSNLHTIFDRYYPNSRKAVIPRKYHLIPDNTIWIVHHHTNNVNLINHLKHVYYYNSQYRGWVNIGFDR